MLIRVVTINYVKIAMSNKSLGLEGFVMDFLEMLGILLSLTLLMLF